MSNFLTPEILKMLQIMEECNARQRILSPDINFNEFDLEIELEKVEEISCIENQVGVK